MYRYDMMVRWILRQIMSSDCSMLIFDFILILEMQIPLTIVMTQKKI